MVFFPVLPSVNKNCERESYPIAQPLYWYLSASAFLFSFKDPNKQLPNVKFEFRSLDHQSSV